MGAWSEKPFGNDTACDWKYEFLEAPSGAILLEAFEVVLSSDYVDGDDGSIAVAAAEVVAILGGRGAEPDGYTEDIHELIAGGVSISSEPLLKPLAAALDKVLGADSELAELWEGDEDWVAEVVGVKRRALGE